jgi:hypothetical protein
VTRIKVKPTWIGLRGVSLIPVRVLALGQP